MAYLEAERLAREERQEAQARGRVAVACPVCASRVLVRVTMENVREVECERCRTRFLVHVSGAA